MVSDVAEELIGHSAITRLEVRKSIVGPGLEQMAFCADRSGRRARLGVFKCGLDQLIEGLGIFNRGLAEHLPVQEDASSLYAIDEDAVSSPPHTACGRDSGDPQSSIISLAVTSVAVRKPTSTHQGDFRLLLVAALCAVVSAGFTEQSSASAGSRSTLANSWHGSLLILPRRGFPLRETLWPDGRIPVEEVHDPDGS